MAESFIRGALVGRVVGVQNTVLAVSRESHVHLYVERDAHPRRHVITMPMVEARRLAAALLAAVDDAPARAPTAQQNAAESASSPSSGPVFRRMPSAGRAAP